jgi:hypothetical protein
LNEDNSTIFKKLLKIKALVIIERSLSKDFVKKLLDSLNYNNTLELKIDTKELTLDIAKMFKKYKKKLSILGDL